MTIAEIAQFYRLTSPFGSRPQFNDFHWGCDFGTPVGVVIHTHMDCKLVLSGTYSGEVILCLEALDGSHNWVIGHCSEALYKAGTVVKAGTLIGKTGNTGNSTGPHAHIEYATGKFRGSVTANHTSGATIDPLPIIQSLQGDDMKTEDYLSDIFDVIADDPWYADSKPEAFKNHLAYVETLDTPARRNWFKQILTDNGVLSKNRMADHYSQDADYQKKAEAEMLSLDQKAINAQIQLDTATERYNTELAAKRGEIDQLQEQLDLALQNAKPVEKWTWRQHLAAAIQKLFGGGD